MTSCGPCWASPRAWPSPPPSPSATRRAATAPCAAVPSRSSSTRTPGRHPPRGPSTRPAPASPAADPSASVLWRSTDGCGRPSTKERSGGSVQEVEGGVEEAEVGGGGEVVDALQRLEAGVGEGGQQLVRRPGVVAVAEDEEHGAGDQGQVPRRERGRGAA